LHKPTGAYYEFEKKLPLSIQLSQYNQSSINGITKWSDGSHTIEFKYDESVNGWRIKLDLMLHQTNSKSHSSRRLHGSFISCSSHNTQSLALVYPLDNQQPAYTHKLPLHVSEGQLTFQGEELNIVGSLASMDWTRSVERRELTWKWASFTGILKDSKTIMVNLCADRFLDKENFMWIDGELIQLGNVEFIFDEKNKNQWRYIRNSKGNLHSQINLEFRPAATKTVNFNALLIIDDFCQSIGSYFGTITPANRGTITIEDFWGVGERHYALW